MAKKVVLVTASWDAVRKYVEPICKVVSSQSGVELVVKEEDYAYLVDHGERDEFGGVEIPQVFVENEGSIKHVFTRIPLTQDGKPDIANATEMLKKALAEA
ncbi:MAG: hypothetical protein M1357_00845 [Candidatus Marsarchaeota archaeon]|nr:hypothetical protein [Candidatus Marsarchaeota archaeon]